MDPSIGPWMGRRVLVTGAAGFIGSHLVEALVQRGARVRAFIRYGSRGDRGWLATIAQDAMSEVEIFTGDVRDPLLVDAAVAGSEVLFHLAALIGIPYSYRAPDSYVAVNVGGTVNVLDSCRRHGVGRVVQTSTSEVYGTAQYVPIDERHPLAPQSPYAASKSAADQLALSYHASFGTPVVVLRPFNTYGPRQSPRAVIPTIISQLLRSSTVQIGSTDPTRDFTYVSDTVDGFIRCAMATGIDGRTIQLGTGHEISVGVLARSIASLLGSELRLNVDQRRVRPGSSEVMRLVSNNALAAATLGWRPQVPLEAGLHSTIEWIRANAHVYRPADYAI